MSPLGLFVDRSGWEFTSRIQGRKLLSKSTSNPYVNHYILKILELFGIVFVMPQCVAAMVVQLIGVVGARRRVAGALTMVLLFWFEVVLQLTC